MRNSIIEFYEFLDRPIFPVSRAALALFCIPLALAVTQPLWRISMEAPQYPKGLYVDIFTYTLKGGNDGQDLQEINTLNHYIGMKPINAEQIPDLGWIPFVLGVLILLTLRVAAIGNVRSLVDLAVLSTYLLGFMAARFVYRLYIYGHDLNPEAAVTVDPFMPAILGTKQIANFTTHSHPLLGTYLILAFSVGAGLVTLTHLFLGRRAYVRERDALRKKH